MVMTDNTLFLITIKREIISTDIRRIYRFEHQKYTLTFFNPFKTCEEYIDFQN